MIVDLICNLKRYAELGNIFQKAFDFITDQELLTLNNGRYDIDGDDIYALISEYKTRDDIGGKLEAHKKYIDIQLVVKGSELIGYAPLQGHEIISEYNEDKDIILFSGEKSFLKIEKGMFAVFFPGELHMPGIKETTKEDVKKVVIKIKA
ncbi:MAG: YhcH/YjgK/YiaL family protein [Ignavibacteriaceae bacterium]|nr:YhcH/YjgK/YiaL family protein [Ignavibacteriaceae bacterium]